MPRMAEDEKPDGAAPGATPVRGAGTVGKALAVLDQVAGFGRPVRFNELLPDSPYPKATLYRLVQTLVAQGMLAADPGAGTYAPGLRLVRLAHSAWRTASLAPVARPHLDRLSAAAGETVHLAQLDHGQVLYLDKRNAREPVEMFAQAGKIGPAHCTGVGKAMLAFLSGPLREAALSRQSFASYTPATLTDRPALEAELAVVRAEGRAFDREEHEPGLICLARPVLGPGGRVLGAVSLAATTARRTLDQLALFDPDLATCARAIAADAEAWRFPEAVADPA